MIWRLQKLGILCEIEKGNIGIQAAIPGKYPLVATSEDRKTHNEYYFIEPAVCIPTVSSTGHGHASLNRIHFQDGKFSAGSILAVCTPLKESSLNAEFLYYYLSFFKDSILVPLMQGSANVTLKISDLKNIEIPLPSFNDQIFLINKFKEYIEKNELLKSELQHQCDLIKKLRKSILQDAVQGEIVKQDPKDEKTSILIEKIKKEKQKLIDSKKTKDKFPLHKNSKEYPPYEIPNNWQWVRFWDIAWCYRGHNPPKTNFIKESKNGYIRFIQITDFKTDTQAVYVPINKQLKLVHKGEIVMAAYRHIGKLSRNMEGAFNVALCKINNIEPFNRDYLELVIKTDLVTGELLAASERGHIPSMHSEHLLSLWVPVPPLSEQERIVAKVQELMQTCDALEKEIEQSKIQVQHLTQSVLREAFEGK